MPNDTIGEIICPIGNHNAQVRQQKNKILYWLCSCGKITPNYREGQEFILENAKMHTIEKVINEPKPELLSAENPVNEKPLVNVDEEPSAWNTFWNS
jgi:hypothetical protein